MKRGLPVCVHDEGVAPAGEKLLQQRLHLPSHSAVEGRVSVRACLDLCIGLVFCLKLKILIPQFDGLLCFSFHQEAIEVRLYPAH